MLEGLGFVDVFTGRLLILLRDCLRRASDA